MKTVFFFIWTTVLECAACRDTFRVWLGNLDTYGARISLAGDYWAAGDTTSANAVLNAVAAAYTLTEAQAADFQRVKYLFGKLYGKNIYNLSQNIINELELFAADTAGYAVGMSQTILRLYGRDYPPIAYLPGEERGQKPSEKKTMKAALANQGVRVYPNPATDHVIFDFQSLNNKANIQIQITDLSGRLVWSRSAAENSESIIVWNTADVRSSVYFFRIVTGKDVNSGKIFLQK